MTHKIVEQQVFKYTYRAYEGDTWDAFALTWRNTDKSVKDFTNATARCQFKKTRNSAALLTLTENTGITLGNSAPNIALTLTSEQTATLGAGTFYFDIEIIQQNKVRTYADCVLILEQSKSLYIDR